MTRNQLIKIVRMNTKNTDGFIDVMDAVDLYIAGSGGVNKDTGDSLEKVEQHLIDEAVSDVILISRLNSNAMAKKLISNQFVVINKQDTFDENNQ